MLYFRLPLLSLGLWTLPALAAAHDTLLPYVFEPLPLGSIKPEGWLYDTMRSMGDGLAGHQFDFYVYVRNSTWIGGDKEYSELAESAPYWFNYIVPLAYGLDDARLKLQVKQFVEYVIAHQGGDGWIGPHVPYGSRDLWPRFPFMLGLTVRIPSSQGMRATIAEKIHLATPRGRSELRQDSGSCDA
ncbi:MAG: hypothetical protein M1829_005487 [Trizodia sp. TS-e1964]|nr:MAG: hypothetical protein M1829_005487 [Trizodia sp. TS-e1964]